MVMLALMILSAPFAAAADGAVLLATAETETEVVPAEVSDVTPAVEAEAGEAEDEEQPWTARYLAPTVLAIGVLGLVAAALVYAARIRGRYRVVE